MFELKVNIEVTLHTGARITLTEEQTKRIKNYAIEVVLGAPDVAPEATKKVSRLRNKKFSAWSPSEDVFINELVDRYAHIKKGVQSRARAADIRQLSKEGLRHRTRGAIYQRYAELAKVRKENEIAQISEWNPVLVNTK